MSSFSAGSLESLGQKPVEVQFASLIVVELRARSLAPPVKTWGIGMTL